MGKTAFFSLSIIQNHGMHTCGEFVMLEQKKKFPFPNSAGLELVLGHTSSLLSWCHFFFFSGVAVRQYVRDFTPEFSFTRD